VIRWLPDILSLSRVPLSFALLFTYRLDAHNLSLALAIFVIANVTDKVDGIVARRMRIASYHGYLVDGFADRTFSVACILAAVAHNGLPLWVSLIAIARELLLYTCRLLAPAAWHPPSRASRLHSVVVFGVTRAWFFGLLMLGLILARDGEAARNAVSVLNAVFAVSVTTSCMFLSCTLLTTIAKCFEDGR
jgi:phosphatidylglycerophosphate synthase